MQLWLPQQQQWPLAVRYGDRTVDAASKPPELLLFCLWTWSSNVLTVCLWGQLQIYASLTHLAYIWALCR